MTNRILSLTGCAFILAVAYASSQPEQAQACVAVDFTLHAYSGPIHVGNACLSSFTHAGNAMAIEAHDIGDGIFHGDFEIWP